LADVADQITIGSYRGDVDAHHKADRSLITRAGSRGRSGTAAAYSRALSRTRARWLWVG
jgi:hypothetical protein